MQRTHALSASRFPPPPFHTAFAPDHTPAAPGAPSQRSSAPATPSLLRPAPTPSGQGPGQGTAPPPSAGPRPASDLQELKEQVKVGLSVSEQRLGSLYFDGMVWILRPVLRVACYGRAGYMDTTCDCRAVVS